PSARSRRRRSSSTCVGEQTQADTEHPDVFADRDTGLGGPHTAGVVHRRCARVHPQQGSGEAGQRGPGDCVRNERSKQERSCDDFAGREQTKEPGRRYRAQDREGSRGHAVDCFGLLGGTVPFLQSRMQYECAGGEAARDVASGQAKSHKGPPEVDGSKPGTICRRASMSTPSLSNVGGCGESRRPRTRRMSASAGNRTTPSSPADVASSTSRRSTPSLLACSKKCRAGLSVARRTRRGGSGGLPTRGTSWSRVSMGNSTA